MSRRILVVDANRQVASATAHVLAAAGYQSRFVTTFDDAVQEIANDCPDMVLTAVRLGPFNGLHLAMRCRAEHPELPILVVGVGSDAALAPEAAQQDIRFVMMPPNYSELLLFVRDLLAGGVTPEADRPRTGSDTAKVVDPKSRALL